MFSSLLKSSATLTVMVALTMGSFAVTPVQAQTPVAATATQSSMTDLVKKLQARVLELQAQLTALIQNQRQSQTTNTLPTGANAASAQIGDEVTATANLRVRNFYSIVSPILGTVPAGTTGTVLNAANDQTGLRWLQIEYETGLKGWSASTFLRLGDVTITPAPVVTCDEFVFEPNVVNLGEETTMIWKTSNAERVVYLADNQYDEALNALTNSQFPLEGRYKFKPRITTTSTLTVYGKNPFNNRATCSATLTVIGGSDVDVDDIQNITENATGPDKKPATCDEFYFSPSTIKSGEKTKMVWKTSNAKSVTYTAASLEGGVIPGLANSNFPVDGEYEFRALNSTESTLTVIGDGIADKDTCRATLTVTETVVEAPKCDYFTFTPSNPKRGGTVTMSWKTSNASRVVLEGSVDGRVVAAISNPNLPVQGSDSFPVYGNSSSTLTVYGAKTTTPAVCSATITITP